MAVIEPTAYDRCDYPEDKQYENGTYQCICNSCGITFYGHKRRIVCKVCYEGAKNTKQQVRPDKSGKCFYPKAFIVCRWFKSGICKSPDGICRST